MPHQVHAPIAAIDVGSNTVHLLVARVDNGTVVPLHDQTALVRLAMDLQPDGRLLPDKIDWAADMISEFHAVATQLGADPILLVATSAVREAPNGGDLVTLVRERTSLDLRIISGEEEAQLTFAGATLHRDPRGRVGVIDSGGGSTELILAKDGSIGVAQSVPEGAGRAVETFLADDPPSPAQFWQLRAHLFASLSTLPQPDVDHLILTGGSANNLRKIALGHDGGDKLSIAEAQDVMRMLARTPSPDVARRYAIDPLRTRTLAGGVTIVVTLWERSGLEHAVVSSTGIREGLVLRQAAARER
jgi:exopolyphosphatase/pppGpp-phosphohydrolase